jgi:exopolyphosphatase / guanosine-5'-triphosphate,3'-diphosphate pyrophosphatase
MDRLRGDTAGECMTILSIDIGTNTVLLLIARVDTGGVITTLHATQRIPRLGKGVDAQRRLAPDAMQRVVAVLNEYREIAAPFRVDAATVCATSAVRDASNRDELVRSVRDGTGLEIDVLSGADEALWGFRGTLSGLPALDAAAVLDIGGGSTELTVGNRYDIMSSTSVDIGSVRLTERFLRGNPPTAMQLKQCLECIHDAIAPFRGRGRGVPLIGVAGTATTLALLDQGKRSFSVEAISGYRLRHEAVASLAGRLASMTVAEILQLTDAMEGRADIITAGTLILREVMIRLGTEELIVSERGVRHGMVLREWERHKGRAPAA